MLGVSIPFPGMRNGPAQRKNPETGVSGLWVYQENSWVRLGCMLPCSYAPLMPRFKIAQKLSIVFVVTSLLTYSWPITIWPEFSSVINRADLWRCSSSTSEIGWNIWGAPRPRPPRPTWGSTPLVHKVELASWGEKDRVSQSHETPKKHAINLHETACNADAQAYSVHIRPDVDSNLGHSG